jgi:serine/threonine-protein kinase PknG
VSGMSLGSIRRQHMENTREPMAVATAIAFMVEILPALGYLHGKNLLYCDFKPENIIQTEEQVKLIDLGAVRHMDDDTSPLYGTLGFQAPEVAELGPSIASDLYMVARTLAVLALDVRGLLDENLYASRLPPVAQVPVFSRYESFYRFLARGSHPDPDVRFPSAEVMEEQLLGVLREVAALDGVPAHPFPSRLFSPEQIANPDGADWRSLPAPYADDGDALAGRGDMKTRSTPPQAERVPTSLETGLRLAQDCIQAGELDRADQTLQTLVNEGYADWRIAWWSGIRALAGGLHQLAAEDFDAVYSQLPGELAPKLALASALEQLGDTRRSSGYYAMVASTDPNCASASFGLARCRLALGDRAGAARALQAVPATSSAHARGQIMLCRVLSATVGGAAPALPDLVLASETVEQVQGDPQQRARLICDLLGSVLAMLHNGILMPHPDVSIAGARLRERDVRRGLERGCRELARYASTREERIRLIDRANHYRPRSLL